MADLVNIAPARIIVEMAQDGTYVIEIYANGGRSRFAVSPGMEAVEIREALMELLRLNVAAARRKAERETMEIKARSRRVYANVLADHGPYFAGKYVGKPVSQRGNLAERPAAGGGGGTGRQTPKPSPKEASAAMAALNDLF